MPATWSLVVPVKTLSRAKSRLAALAGEARERLALAVALDTVSAASRCPAVRSIVVVTDDPVAAPALAGLGARVVPDVPDAGLNPALRYGARLAADDSGVHGIGALSADLPALRPEELDRTLDAASEWSWAFLPDATSTGTTLYAARSGTAFRPAFGPGSRAGHLDTGAHELVLSGVETVRRDVDTPGDLRTALLLGVGPRTGEVVSSLGLPSPTA